MVFLILSKEDNVEPCDLEELLEEIKNVFLSKRFLSGSVESIPDIEMRTGMIAYTCKVGSVDLFFDSISIANERTIYTDLEEDILLFASRAYYKLSSYLEQRQEECISNQISSIVKAACNATAADALVDALAKKRGLNDNDAESLQDVITGTISRHIAAIAHIRVVTLSRRFMPLELLLRAYKEGLFPFGLSYQDGSLCCLNPKNLT